jgi:hypothetical protein
MDSPVFTNENRHVLPLPKTKTRTLPIIGNWGGCCKFYRSFRQPLSTMIKVEMTLIVKNIYVKSSNVSRMVTIRPPEVGSQNEDVADFSRLREISADSQE